MRVSDARGKGRAQTCSHRVEPLSSCPAPCPQRREGAVVDLAERNARSKRAESMVAGLAAQGVVAVATTFVDNSGIARVKSVPLARLPQLSAWGVGFSTAFDYFRLDDWVAAPATGEGPVGDQRIIPDLSRVVTLAA